VPQDAALRAIASKIRDKVLMGSLDRLEAAIVKQIGRQASEAVSVDKAALRRSITSVDRKIHKATDRLVTVDDSLVPMVEAKLLELQEERRHMESELEAANPKRRTLDAREVAQRIWQLDEVMRKGSPTVVRHALSKIIKQVTLNFEKGELTRRGQSMRFVGGRIELHTNGVRQPCWPS